MFFIVSTSNGEVKKILSIFWNIHYSEKKTIERIFLVEEFENAALLSNDSDNEGLCFSEYCNIKSDAQSDGQDELKNNKISDIHDSLQIRSVPTIFMGTTTLKKIVKVLV